MHRHLGLKKELSPHARGFQKSFTYLAGAGSHYNHEPQLTTDIPRLPSLIGTGLWMSDDQMLDREKDLPSDFYSSRTFTDRMLDFLGERSAEEKEKPFLACLTYTAPHWPLQAPKESIVKYKGKYDGGPEVLRQQRLAALKNLGIIAQDVVAAPVTDYLKKTDDLDNTFVLFMSDNGAEGAILEAFPVLNGISMADVIERFMDNSLENMGTETSYVWYGPR
jgi:arylsulfatase A-like enzyme